MRTETVSGGSTSTFFSHGLSVDEHLAQESSGRLSYYHADGLGSVVAVTDNNHMVAEKISYTSFGLSESVPTSTNSFTYTGREWDKETRLYYYRARHYDPMEGRFISKDPVGFTGGDVNLYAYVGNKSVNFTDPFGLSRADEFEKGSYRFLKYPGDTFHGEAHWHVYDRKSTKLFGRVGVSGKVLTGCVPKSALKILVSLGKIAGLAVGIVLELSSPSEAGDICDSIPCENKKTAPPVFDNYH